MASLELFWTFKSPNFAVYVWQMKAIDDPRELHALDTYICFSRGVSIYPGAPPVGTRSAF